MKLLDREIIPIIKKVFYDDYGGIEYKGKTVLDVGADWGCTAKFFFEIGAKKVIAVEKHWRYYLQLWVYSLLKPRLTTVYMDVNRKEDYEYLIGKYNPNIVKLDCEGAEEYLLELDTETLNKVDNYVMEVHSDRLNILLIKKFEECGFLVTKNYWRDQHIMYLPEPKLENLWILHAKKKEGRKA